MITSTPFRRSTALSLLAVLTVVGVALALMARPVHADVTATPASGGTAISADTAATGGTGAYTTLGAITIAEGVATDIAVGAGVNLILTAPAGFEFNTAQVPDVTGLTADLTSLAMSYPTATTMQLLLTSGATGVVDSVVIGGVTAIQVRPLTGTLPSTGNVLRVTGNAGNAVIAGVVLDSTNFGTLTKVVGASSKLALTTPPTASTVAGVAIATQPVVTIQDQFGNTATGDSTTVVTATLSTGSGTLAGTVTKTAASGVADFVANGLAIDLVGTDKVLTFTSAPVFTSAASAAFTITHAAANKLILTTPPSASSAPGVAFAQQPVVTIQDAFNNTVTSDSTTVITAALTTGSGTLAGTATKTAASGIADFAANNLAIDLVGTDKVLTFTSAPVFTPAVSAAFTIAAPVASAATSTITAASTEIPADNTTTSTITVQLKDGGSANLSSGGDTVTLNATGGSVGSVTDNGDGTYTATLTSTVVGTATITGTVNSVAITDNATVLVTNPPEPPPTASVPGIEVALEKVTSGPASDVAKAVLTALAGDGSEATVSVPAAALPSGSTLEVAAVSDPAELAAQTAPPAGVGLLLGFSITAADAAGAAVTSGFNSPVTLEFTVDASSLPAGAGTGELRIAFWNGTAWIPLDSAVTINADGSATISADTNHFSLYSVIHDAEGFGRIGGQVPATGVGFVTFGGSVAELQTAMVAAGCSTPAFVTSNGAWVSYLPDAPFAAINADFEALFAEGVPLGRALIVSNCG